MKDLGIELEGLDTALERTVTLGRYGAMHSQCSEAQGNNSAQALSTTKIALFGCKKTDRPQKKKETNKRTDKELM